MPYRNLTLPELARHIGMDARDVQRMADKGTLPGHRVGGEWRFNRAALLDWLQREIPNLDPAHIRNLERAMSDQPDEAVFERLLALESVEMCLPARSKGSTLRELVRLAQRSGLVYDFDHIVEALEAREALCSTALPGGIALPHPRTPLPYATAEPLLCLARVPGGIPFGSPDGRLTDLFVLICSHDERQHLQVLARLALMFQTRLAEQLRECDDPAETLDLLLKTERELLVRRRA